MKLLDNLVWGCGTSSIEKNILIKAKIINSKISTRGDEGQISYVISYSYFWEGKDYKNVINARKAFFKELKNKESIYVYLDPTHPGKTYLEPEKVIHTGAIVFFILWIVFLFVGLAFLLTALILYIIHHYQR